MRPPRIVPVPVVLVGLLALVAAPRVGADAMPEGFRGVGYRMTISNLAEYAEDYAFIVYPTREVVVHRGGRREVVGAAR